MALDVTREELQDDIRKITTEVVAAIVDDSRHKMLRTIDEDLLGLSQRTDNVGHRVDQVGRRVDRVERRINETNQLLRTHVTNLNAHTPA
jgi:flagellar biosynthesis/type III secretory pathway protein FliH